MSRDIQQRGSLKPTWLSSVSCAGLTLALVSTSLPVANAQNVDVAAEEDAPKQLETIVVTGFRKSLEESLDLKRNAVNSTESIVAEDMGKMPDLNLAESIQRVPGVAISREGGEGRQVTLRGLGPQFTRTTLNGMEVPASSDGLDSSGGLNGSRAFDFNVFSSELFNRIDIQKSSKASTEEGGIAGTVDLYTPRPFDKPGFNVSGGVKMGYNDLTEEMDPRGSVLISNTFGDTFGIIGSLAYTQRTVRQEGFGSVRWQSPSNNGRTWADTSATVVNGTIAEGRTLDDVMAPRLPRLDYFGNDQERIGGAVALQYRPTANMDFVLDVVHSELENYRDAYNLMGQFRNLFDSITPLEVSISEDGKSLTSGTFDNVVLRVENRLTESTTKFDQLAFNGDIDLDDNKSIHFILGASESDFRVEQYRFNLTAIEGTTMGFNFTGDENFPSLTYGFDVTDPSNFGFTGPTIRANDVKRKNVTAGLDFTWEIGASNLKAGVIFNDREIDTLTSNVVERTEPTSLDGLTTLLPVSNFGEGIASGGIPGNFVVADYDATIAAYQLGPWVPDAVDGGTFNIQEKTQGAYVEFSAEAELLGRPLRSNAGVRVVETEITSAGSVPTGEGDVAVSVTNSFTTVLPSTNFAWELSDDVQMRLNMGRTMSRPGLGALSPTSTYSGVNGTLSGGNPFLDPILSNQIDIGVEWYFAPESVLAATLFYKDIDGFVATFSESGRVDAIFADLILTDVEYDAATWVNPINDDYIISRPLNNDGSELTGFELAYQQPFTFMPGALSNLGVQANYTYVKSESEYGQGASALTAPLIGLSEHSWNATVYYETEVYGGRLSANGRSEYNTTVPGRNGSAEEATDGSVNIDASAFWNINDFVTLTFEAINLTDEDERLFVTGDGSQDLVREYNHTGRQFFVGARMQF